MMPKAEIKNQLDVWSELESFRKKERTAEQSIIMMKKVISKENAILGRCDSPITTFIYQDVLQYM